LGSCTPLAKIRFPLLFKMRNRVIINRVVTVESIGDNPGRWVDHLKTLLHTIENQRTGLQNEPVYIRGS
jgi:hypothetical protein